VVKYLHEAAHLGLPTERAGAAGRRLVHAGRRVPHRQRAYGENIARGGKTGREVVEGWVGSQVHRDNVLKPEYAEIGVGVARNKKGETYCVQVFGKR
jgi:uncharacterized protein YkwD